jgi:hypothetical protein
MPAPALLPIAKLLRARALVAAAVTLTHPSPTEVKPTTCRAHEHLAKCLQETRGLGPQLVSSTTATS